MSPGYHTPPGPRGRGRVGQQERPAAAIDARDHRVGLEHDAAVSCGHARGDRRVARPQAGGPRRGVDAADHRQGARGGVQRAHQPRHHHRRPRRRPLRRQRRAGDRGAVARRRRTARSSNATAGAVGASTPTSARSGSPVSRRVVAGDAAVYAARVDADIAFADPPYDFDAWDDLLTSIAAGRSWSPSRAARCRRRPAGSRRAVKRYGRTWVTFLARTG